MSDVERETAPRRQEDHNVAQPSVATEEPLHSGIWTRTAGALPAAAHLVAVMSLGGVCITFGISLVGPEEFVQFRYVVGGFFIGVGIQVIVLQLEVWASRFFAERPGLLDQAVLIPERVADETAYTLKQTNPAATGETAPGPRRRLERGDV